MDQNGQRTAVRASSQCWAPASQCEKTSAGPVTRPEANRVRPGPRPGLAGSPVARPFIQAAPKVRPPAPDRAVGHLMGRGRPSHVGRSSCPRPSPGALEVRRA